LLERVFVPIEEPLVAQLRSFLGCARERTAPEVDLEMGICCLSVAQAIRDSIADKLPSAQTGRTMRECPQARARRPSPVAA
jgi:hypothetical protein